MTTVKTGLKSISEGSSDIFKVDPRKIKVRLNWNGRDFNDPANVEHVDMLAKSISKIGVKEPLTVSWENGEAWLVDGECRLRGALRAIEVYKAVDLKTIPVKAEDRYANDAEKLFSQIIRNSGKPFSQMERAKVFKRLLDLGWKQQDIADKAGVTSSAVSQILNLLTMPEPIKQMVSEGKISASMAVTTLKDHNPVAAVKVLQDAVAVAAGEGSAKAMPKHVMQPPSRPAPSSEPVKTPVARGEIEKIVSNAFEFADVDDSAQDIVIIKMPVEQWEAIRKACKL